MKTTNSFAWVLAAFILVALIFAPFANFDVAQSQGVADGVIEESGTSHANPISRNFVPWSEEDPGLSRAQEDQLKFWSERTNLSGPARPVRDPEEVSQSAGEAVSTLPEDLAGSSGATFIPSASWITRKTLFGSIIPRGFSSNVMESSLGQNGRFVFFTGNWFTARSTDGGLTWAYVTPFLNMPDFCCDQVSISDESRNAIFWLRMGLPDQSGKNRFILSASKDGGASFCSYSISPESTNAAWTGQWWDYPHIQLGDDYLFLSWNMFNNLSQWTRTVMLRLPLDDLVDCDEITYKYVFTSSWFTFVPVQGAGTTMYFASNWAIQAPNNRLGIWRWDESADNPTFYSRSITAWNYTNRGEALCGAVSGNWAARSDDRLLAGSIFKYKGLYPNRPVIGFWWNAKQGGVFPHPYIEGAAFFADTLAQVPGSPGRPFVYSKSTCMMYPSAASNPEGYLGMVFHYGNGTNLNPAAGFTVSDSPPGTLPGFVYFPVQASAARPADIKWGDYNTVRWIPSYPNTWSAGSHYIPQSLNCTNCSAPVFFTFTRGKIYQSFVPITRR